MRRVRGSVRSGGSVSGTRRVPFLRTRRVRSTLAVLVLGLGVVLSATAAASAAEVRQASVDRAVTRGLDWLAVHQSRLGHWVGRDGRYPTSMTALAGVALLCEGSTTTQGKYAAEHPQGGATTWSDRSRTNGLIGDPTHDDRYTYGHGFSMLFLSQVLGEEEDVERREQLVDVLTQGRGLHRPVPRPRAGGWGYVSAKDGGDFDEGSTTITQVQGLRGCRNAGIPVPKEIIDKAVKYIRNCTGADGGVQYNSADGGGPAGHHRRGHRLPVQRRRLRQQVRPQAAGLLPAEPGRHLQNEASATGTTPIITIAQVLYREGGKNWEHYRDKIYARHSSPKPNQDGYWDQGYIGPVYTTAINLTILQLRKGVLPIYQR